MAIDYKRELETAANNMILIHRPNILVKMIVRTIVKKVKVNHAIILLYNKEKDAYSLVVSRGQANFKLPPNSSQIKKDNPLVRFFIERKQKQLFNDGAFVYHAAKKYLQRAKTKADNKRLFKKALDQMEAFKSIVCIPSYFRQDLLGLLILGNKTNGRSFSKEELNFFVALASNVTMAIRNAQLFKALESELDTKRRLFINTTIALAAVIDAKDRCIHGHTARVTNLSLNIAKRLALQDKKVFNDKFIEVLHIASLLHDIGKIGVPEAILNKEEPLTEEEIKKIREHPVIGATILKPIKELGDSILGVKYHHERCDGSGYPEGLKSGQIPLIASIISVADAFDAMTTDRPYRRRLSKQEAVEEIKCLSSKQFDSKIVNVLVELYQEGRA